MLSILVGAMRCVAVSVCASRDSCYFDDALASVC